jgi:anthranilate synthase component 1
VSTVVPDKESFRKLAGQGNLIPVFMDLLADLETPVSVFSKLTAGTAGETAFLLESVEGGERWARYSFLGTSARERVAVYRTEVEIIERETTRVPHGGAPLAVLRSCLARYRPVQVPGLPRFWGGAVGYLAYEMASFFESRVPSRLPDDEPYAEFFITDNLVIFDNVRHTMTLVAHAFLGDGRSVDECYDAAISRLVEMRRLIQEPLPAGTSLMVTPEERGEPKFTRMEPAIAPSRYTAMVERTKEYILEGDIIQAVIAQGFRTTPAPDGLLLYRAMRYINPSPYLYYVSTGTATLVGSSPETMVRLENGLAVLRPIAGTRRRGRTEQEDRRLADELLADPKERAEHLMLVDLGRNDLGRVAETGTVQVTDLMIVERYSHVMHLVSQVTCELKESYDALDLLRAAFPAGTLSGAPKVRAMEIIAELENEPRGAYGGAVGYFSFTGNMDLAITIRTAVIRDGLLEVKAGAGIVADSIPDQELRETENKARATERALEFLASQAFSPPLPGGGGAA